MKTGRVYLIACITGWILQCTNGQCPTETTISPSKALVGRGDLRRMQCLTPGSIALENPRFFKDGEELAYGGNVIVNPSTFVQITSASFENEGVYTCLPSQGSGCNSPGIQQRRGYLLVATEKNASSLRRYSGSVGGEVTLECGLLFGSLSHTHTIDWVDTHGNAFASTLSPAPSGDKYVLDISTFQLTIKRVSHDDERLSAFGGYVCRSHGSNLVDTNAITAADPVELQVVDPPIVSEVTLQPKAVKLGQSLLAWCVVTWKEDVGIVQWWIGSRRLSGSQYSLSTRQLTSKIIQYEIRILQATLDDCGPLTCRSLSSDARGFNLDSTADLLILYSPLLEMDGKEAAVTFSKLSSSPFTLLFFTLPVRQYTDPSSACSSHSAFHQDSVANLGGNVLRVDLTGQPESEVTPGEYILAVQMASAGNNGPCALAQQPISYGTASQSLPGGVIAGIVLGLAAVVVVVVILVIVTVVCCLCCHPCKNSGTLILAKSPTPSTGGRSKLGQQHGYSNSVNSLKDSVLTLNRPSHHTSHFELSLQTTYGKTNYDRSTSVADSWSYSPTLGGRSETIPRANQHMQAGVDPSFATFPRTLAGHHTVLRSPPPIPLDAALRSASMGSIYEVPVSGMPHLQPLPEVTRSHSTGSNSNQSDSSELELQNFSHV